MRRGLLVGNWKMNGTEPEAERLVAALLPQVPPAPERPDVALAPPFTSLQSVGEALRGTGIDLASQNLHAASHGAFTGEISASMLAALGVRYAIVGHSERRRLFGETDEDVSKKAAAAQSAGLTPILCVGEEEAERIDGRTLAVIERQVRAGASRLAALSGEKLVIAYEPVWAIGTGRTPSPEQVSEVHHAIRGTLGAIVGGVAGAGEASRIRILYGGSATPETAKGLLLAPGVDGALVGGASLVADSFAALIRMARVQINDP